MRKLSQENVDDLARAVICEALRTGTTLTRAYYSPAIQKPEWVLAYVREYEKDHPWEDDDYNKLDVLHPPSPSPVVAAHEKIRSAVIDAAFDSLERLRLRIIND